MRPLLCTQVSHVVDTVVKTALKNDTVPTIYRNARICMTPGGEPYVKVIQNGETIDKLKIVVMDSDNTRNALEAIKKNLL